MTSFWRWAGALQRWRERRILARRAIPDDLWSATLAQFPFLALPKPADALRLRTLTSLFLDAKQFSGAQGLVVSDAMAVTIAAQACLPLIHLDLSWYDGFVDLVVHANELTTRRERLDDDGIVHEFDDVFSGETPEAGPITLSWHDVGMAGDSGDWAYNVVVHEMAHVLDLRNGLLDGMPPLRSRAEQVAWQSALARGHERLAQQVAQEQPTALDPYGAESPEEFFAVACESFFVTPHRLRRADPVLYRVLRDFFRQDPARRSSERPACEASTAATG